MITRFEKLWILVGVIWLTALGLTYWNSARIDEIRLLRERTQRYAIEHTFQNRYAKKLQWVAAYDQAQRLPVESAKLGIIRIRNHLFALAQSHGLRDVDINTQMGQVMDSKLPISLKVRGTMPDAMGFLNILNGYAYLTAASVRITVYADVGQVELGTKLIFQFRIHSPKKDHPQVFQSGKESAPYGRPT